MVPSRRAGEIKSFEDVLITSLVKGLGVQVEPQRDWPWHKVLTGTWQKIATLRKAIQSANKTVPPQEEKDQSFYESTKSPKTYSDQYSYPNCRICCHK
jgi:hypothetical protein